MQSRLSMVWERVNTIIERDIGLSVIVVLAGLLYSDKWGIRGLPIPWLLTSHGRARVIRPELFFLSIFTSAAIVVLCEVIVAIVRRTTEPVAFRDTANSGVYVNTYEHSEDFTDIDDMSSFEAKDTSNYRKALRKELRKTRKLAYDLFPEAREARESGAAEKHSEKTIRSSVKTVGDSRLLNGKKADNTARRSEGEKKRLSSVGAIVVIIFAVISVIIPMLDSNDSYDYDDDDNWTYNDEYDYESVDDDFMHIECQEAIEAIGNGNADTLADMGLEEAMDIDVMNAFTDAIDWKNAEIYRQDGYTSPDAGETVLKYIAQTDAADYIIAIKFSGDAVNDSSNAVFAGIAICPYSILEDYYNDDIKTLEDLTAAVIDNSIVIGDDYFLETNMMEWVMLH